VGRSEVAPRCSGRPIVAESSLSEWLNASREHIRRELDKLAYAAHLDQPALVGTADIRQSALIAALVAASKDLPDTKGPSAGGIPARPRRLAGLARRGAVPVPPPLVSGVSGRLPPGALRLPRHAQSVGQDRPNRWREVALLAAARSKGAPSAIWELVEELCAKDDAPAEDAPEPGNAAQWGALLAAQVLHETGLAAPDPNLQARHERKRERVRDWQVRLLRSTVLPARERALAGDLLARLGDPRQHLLDVDHLRFAAVPRGPFWMGEPGNEDAELHCNAGLDYDYWIAQTPVTVAQFRQFVAASGYDAHDPDCLRAPENRRWSG